MKHNTSVSIAFDLNDFSVNRAVELLQKHRDELEAGAEDARAIMRERERLSSEWKVGPPTNARQEWCIDIENVIYECFDLPW